MANKTDRNDAAGIAQIVRTGWFRQVHVRSEASYIIRARLAARTTLVRQRCEVDKQIRGLRLWRRWSVGNAERWLSWCWYVWYVGPLGSPERARGGRLCLAPRF